MAAGVLTHETLRVPPVTGGDVTRGRWRLVVAAVLVQLALGSVYAWSVFNKPLQAQFGWSKAQAVLPFEVALGTIFLGSLLGGRLQSRCAPPSSTSATGEVSA